MKNSKEGERWWENDRVTQTNPDQTPSTREGKGKKKGGPKSRDWTGNRPFKEWSPHALKLPQWERWCEPECNAGHRRMEFYKNRFFLSLFGPWCGASSKA